MRISITGTSISTPNMLERFHQFAGIDGLRLISLMDRTPGRRQWIDLDKYRARVKKLDALTDDELDVHIQHRHQLQQQYATQNERELLAWLQHRDLPLASHDDATPAHQLGMKILMGAPNLMLGGSHSGNVATSALASRGLLHILSSDYVPTSLLAGALQLHHDLGFSLPAAIATVTANPAKAAGFTDRGELAIGKRADFIRVRMQHHLPLIQAVWRAGQRVA